MGFITAAARAYPLSAVMKGSPNFDPRLESAVNMCVERCSGEARLAVHFLYFPSGARYLARSKKSFIGDGALGKENYREYQSGLERAIRTSPHATFFLLRPNDKIKFDKWVGRLRTDKPLIYCMTDYSGPVPKMFEGSNFLPYPYNHAQDLFQWGYFSFALRKLGVRKLSLVGEMAYEVASMRGKWPSSKKEGCVHTTKRYLSPFFLWRVKVVPELTFPNAVYSPPEL